MVFEFFSYRIFRQAKMELLKQMGRMELHEREAELLAQHDKMCAEMAGRAFPESHPPQSLPNRPFFIYLRAVQLFRLVHGLK